jgi:hypothetical protein
MKVKSPILFLGKIFLALSFLAFFFSLWNQKDGSIEHYNMPTLASIFSLIGIFAYAIEARFLEIEKKMDEKLNKQ